MRGIGNELYFPGTIREKKIIVGASHEIRHTINELGRKSSFITADSAGRIMMRCSIRGKADGSYHCVVDFYKAPVFEFNKQNKQRVLWHRKLCSDIFHQNTMIWIECSYAHFLYSFKYSFTC